MDTRTESLDGEVDDGEEFGSRSAVFAEPPTTLSDLPPIVDPELFEDEETPERLKAIIRHMRKLAGRRELSAMLEFVPMPNGGKRFVVTFPEGDELAICRVFAQEVRREGVEDPAVCARLNAAHEQVQRAKRTVDAVECTAAVCGDLAGDIIDVFNKLYMAHQDGDVVGVWDLVEQVHERLENQALIPFFDFLESCQAERVLRDAQKRMDALREDRLRKAKEEGVEVWEDE